MTEDDVWRRSSDARDMEGATGRDTSLRCARGL